MDYYTSFIKNHSGWEFVKVYTDEGISGLNTKKRDGFNEMIFDALAGKIDLIITKSVSRFARNTVDSLVIIRKLKDKGVEVYFEKENIWTFDSKGELLLTIMSSLAQEESRSISENVTWGQRKGFPMARSVRRTSTFSDMSVVKTRVIHLLLMRNRQSLSDGYTTFL
ncbi:MAG: recombinase family protein [Ruminococcus sp.]|nr:recombinase family protein [Ruminococcus sp.]MDD5889290.1 recombinase family protein [Ruminococcus sp.]